MSSSGSSKSKSETSTNEILAAGRFVEGLGEVGFGAEASAFEGVVELLAVEFEFVRFGGGGDGFDGSRPTDDDARKGLGDEETVPGVEGPFFLGQEVEGADGFGGHLGEFYGAYFGLVDGPAWTVGGEDDGLALLEDALEGEQAGGSATGAGAADAVVAEEAEGAGDELSVKALADDDGAVKFAEVPGAEEGALVPEAEDAPGGRGGGDGSFFRDDLKAQGDADERDDGRRESRDDRDGDALGECEARAGHLVILWVK